MSTYKLLPSETVLENDYPVYLDYFYIVDGVIKMSTIEGTVADLKRAEGANEIRRYELFKRPEARLGDRVEE